MYIFKLFNSFLFENSALNVYKESPDLSHSESLYNGVIVHPVIYTTTLALSGNTVKFIHGEDQLQAVTKQLK
jgi:hypothetical protein